MIRAAARKQPAVRALAQSPAQAAPASPWSAAAARPGRRDRTCCSATGSTPASWSRRTTTAAPCSASATGHSAGRRRKTRRIRRVFRSFRIRRPCRRRGPGPPGHRRPDLFAAVGNPIAASGGSDPETLTAIKLSAPRAFKRQRQAVTAEDYAAFAESHPDVQRAVAELRWTGSWRTIFIAVDRRGGRRVDAAFRTSCWPSSNLVAWLAMTWRSGALLRAARRLAGGLRRPGALRRSDRGGPARPLRVPKQQVGRRRLLQPR